MAIAPNGCRQRVPLLWDVVCHAVDEPAGARGDWILTGSSTPHFDETSYGGAGRVGRIPCGPISADGSPYGRLP